MAKTLSTPPHPSVDWAQRLQRPGQHTQVRVTCPICLEARWEAAAAIAYRIKLNTYTGRCYRDRLLHKRRIGSLPRPEHPAVDWNDTQIKNRVTHVAVTCPLCGGKRYAQPGSTASHIRDGRFTGRCLACAPHCKKREWVALGPGRRVDPLKGYIRLTRLAIVPDEYPLYEAMCNRWGVLFEHRFVMAKALGRPLWPNELVDHMDGNKLNNDPSNLRLYIRGKNMPGETNGYGTYYHEWQMALSRIRELEAQLTVHRGS